MEFIIAIFISFFAIMFTKRNLSKAFFLAFVIYSIIYAFLLYEAQKAIFPIGSLDWEKTFPATFIIIEALAGFVIPFFLIAVFYNRLTKQLVHREPKIVEKNISSDS